MINLVLLNSIRREISNAVKDFIHLRTSRDEILLIRCPAGLGATYNTRETVFSKDIYTVWFAPGDIQTDEVASLSNVPVLEGLKKRNCIKYLIANDLRARMIYPQRILCPDCTYRNGCPYHEMRKIVKKSQDGLCTHHNFIKTKFVSECVSKSNKEFNALVIDGYCLESLIDKKKFNSEDLKNFQEFILLKWLPATQNPTFLKFLIRFTGYLQKLILVHNDLKGSQFLKELLDEIYRDYSAKDFDYFSKININYYVQDFYKLIKQNTRATTKNLLEPIFGIIQLTNKLQHRISSEMILPFEISSTRDREFIYRAVKMHLPGNIPLIIIDPNTPSEVYEQVFNKKINVLDIIAKYPSLHSPSNLKIYQLDRGFYPKESLKNPQTREGLFLIISKYLKLKRDTSYPIYIAGEYQDSLNTFLYDKRLSNFETFYFYDSISRGSSVLRNYDNLIIVGDVEPNPDTLKKQIEMLHIGEEPLDMSFDKRTRTFKDSRVQVFYSIKNNEEVRNIIYRLRPFTSPQRKIVLLLSKIEIKDATEKLSLDELLFRIRNKNMALSSKTAPKLITKDGDEIARRIKIVVRRQKRSIIPFSTIIRLVKGRGRYRNYKDRDIERIITMLFDTRNRTVIKS